MYTYCNGEKNTTKFGSNLGPVAIQAHTEPRHKYYLSTASPRVYLQKYLISLGSQILLKTSTRVL